MIRLFCALALMVVSASAQAQLVEGGVRQKLSAGDIVRIPQKTPHQILLDGSKGSPISSSR
jgi:hypothetical protein